MYRMVIADDEKFIQESLVSLIDWESLGFEVVSVFGDGADVIEYLNSMPADVILTDIRMRDISGIDIARYVHDCEMPCKVVFISGYKEFDLALQAIKFGVNDYILKPSKVEEVKSVFVRIRKELAEKKKTLEFRKKVQERWAEIHPILEEKFLNELVLGTLQDKKDILQKMNLLYPEVDAGNSPCMLVDLSMKNYDAFISQQWNYSTEQFDEAIYNFILMLDHTGSFHIIQKKREKICLLVMLKAFQKTQEENLLIFHGVMDDFIKQFQSVFKIEVVLTRELFFENVLEIAASQIGSREWKRQEIDIPIQLKERKKWIMTNIMSGNINMAHKIMRDTLLNLDRINDRYAINFAVDTFSCISNFLQENNYELFLLVQPYIDYYSIVNLDRPSQLTEYCDCIFAVMKSKEALSNQFDKKNIIHHIKAYVEEHIYEDISLDNLADELYICTAHLNRIFKKQTGETFLQYVIRKKMEKAVELLNDPRYKVYQVSDRLGYKTTRYFSKVFFNCTGYYPSQYRKEVLKMGDSYNDGSQV